MSVWAPVGTAPFFSSRKRNCLHTSTVLVTGLGRLPSFVVYLFFLLHLQVFLPHISDTATDRLCLAFTSQRSTGVTTAVASARPSRPAHGSQTAVDMRRPSGSVLGMSSHSFIHLHGAFVCNYCPFLTNFTIDSFYGVCANVYLFIHLIDCQRIVLETFAMPVCYWWRGGRSFLMAPRRTGTM